MSWKIVDRRPALSVAESEIVLSITTISSFSRNGTSSSTSKYPLYHQQQQPSQQQYYHQQPISKSKRSKSMDDFGSQMVFEQSSRIHRNNVRNGNGSGYHPSSSSSQMGKRSPPTSAQSRSSNHHPSQPQHKNQMRYSVDNLLEIDTSYYNNYQVKHPGFFGMREDPTISICASKQNQDAKQWSRPRINFSV